MILIRQQWLLITAHWPLWGWLVALPVSNLSLLIILTYLLLNVISLKSNCKHGWWCPWAVVLWACSSLCVCLSNASEQREVCNQMLFEGLICSYCWAWKYWHKLNPEFLLLRVMAKTCERDGNFNYTSEPRCTYWRYRGCRRYLPMLKKKLIQRQE